MRRTLALLALLATSWPHAVVLECALASEPPAEETGAAMHAGPSAGQDENRRAHHGGHHHGGGDAHHGSDPAGPRTDASSDAPPGGPQCAMVMACGLVMAQAGPGPAQEATSDTRAGPPARTPAAPLAVELSADTPPPRLSA